jgi:hypothetical protein
MDDEGMTTPSHPHRLPQPVYMPDQQITALPLQQINGKEICAAGMPGAAIVRHKNNMPDCRLLPSEAIYLFSLF